AAIDAGDFRSDLYYRLNVFPIETPPLRQRREDIPLLVRHFVQQFARRMKKTVESVSVETMSRLCEYHWPGNVRELQNVVEGAVILSSGPVLNVAVSDLKNNAPPTKMQEVGIGPSDFNEQDRIVRLLGNLIEQAVLQTRNDTLEISVPESTTIS